MPEVPDVPDLNWSFQLYSARNFQPWSGVLAMLAELGYSQVEGFAGVYADPGALRAELDRNGLTMPTGHFSLDILEDDLDHAIAVAEALGIELLVCPHIAAALRPGDAAGWRAFGRRLAGLAAALRAAGRDFAWHNHDFEFAPLPDGSTPLQHILAAAPDLGWQMDVGWTIRAGADPLRWIEEHGRRIVAVHVKDIARPGTGLDEDGWSDVGHGTVDWPGLMAALRARSAARFYVMEQDNPSDVERFARRSIEAARTF
jgi:sugar phosphate isomerase/epimerase